MSRVEVVASRGDDELARTLGVGSVTRVELVDEHVLSDPSGAVLVEAHMRRYLRLVEERRPSRDLDDPLLVDDFYALSDTLRAWRKTIPSAAALYPLYEPRGRLADGAPIDDVGGAFFTHVLDGQGIRSRGATVRWLLTGALDGVANDGQWLSLACGAAQPVLSAASAEQNRSAVIILDWDQDALDLSLQAASELGVRERTSAHLANVLKLEEVDAAVPAEACQVVECLGFFEYLPDKESGERLDASDFLRLAWSRVAPGGVLLFANMLDTHPELGFTIHTVRWPLIQPRSLERILEIVERAGISREDVAVWLPGDGVYALITIRRP
jgi:hypothetical protein